MDNLKNLDRLPDAIREKVTRYMTGLLSLHQDNTVSIYVYGDAASGYFMPKASSINSTIVLKQLGFQQLKQSLNHINSGIRNKFPAPLFLTPEHIKTSCDTFPMEFLEMKENHVLLYGDDLLAGLEINPSNIRFVCEEQLKGKLIRIRQAYLEIGLRRRGMEALIKESLYALVPSFRGLLRLKDITPPTKKEEIIKQLGETFHIDAELFLAVLRDDRNDEKISGQDIESFLEEYIEQIGLLAEIADRL